MRFTQTFTPIAWNHGRRSRGGPGVRTPHFQTVWWSTCTWTPHFFLLWHLSMFILIQNVIFTHHQTYSEGNMVFQRTNFCGQNALKFTCQYLWFKKFFRLANARHKRRKTEGRGGEQIDATYCIAIERIKFRQTGLNPGLISDCSNKWRAVWSPYWIMSSAHSGEGRLNVYSQGHWTGLRRTCHNFCASQHMKNVAD